MAAVRSWLLALIAVSLVCALAEALMPKGAVKRTGRLVCGLVLLSAILSPLRQVDVTEGKQWLESYLAGLEVREGELEEAADSQMKIIIEQEYAAYIVDKAAEFGLSCSAQVECRKTEEGLYLPNRTEVAGAFSEKAQAKLIRVITEDLGVPKQAQHYINEEEMP